MRTVAWVVCAALAGCAVYDASLLLDGSVPEDAAPGDAGADVDTCNHAYPPPRPDASDPSDASIELVVAVQTVDFGLDGGVFGFDLDHTCTCPGPESCVPQPAAKAEHCDEPGGRDNSGGILIQALTALSPDLTTARLDTQLDTGKGSLLFRVRDWNGLPDDDQVEVAVFASNGTLPLTDAGANPVPKNDGTDIWSLDPSSVVGNPPPVVAVNEDVAAYVSGGVVVASVPFGLGVGQGFGPGFLRLNEALLVATLTATPQGYTLAGTVAGRWDTRNLLTGLQGVRDPFDSSKYLCGSDTTYQQFKALICGGADIASQSTNDNTGAPCDALSLAVGITAAPAQIGAVVPYSAQTPPCGATYSDQCGP